MHNIVADEEILARLERLTSVLGQHALDVHLEPNHAMAALASVSAMKARHDADNDDAGGFDLTEAVHDAVDAVWRSRCRASFSMVRAEIAEEIRRPMGYLDRCAERLGHDFGSQVESSDWLTAMNAQARAARAFDALSDLSATPRLLSALDDAVTMLETLAAAMPPMDGGEEPFLLCATREGLSGLLPLLGTRYSQVRRRLPEAIAAPVR